MKTTFPLELISGILGKSRDARCVPCDGPEGWSKSDVNPMGLLAVFESLQLKTGYNLRAYQFRSNSNGNGVIWAMKEESPFLAPNEVRLHLPDAIRSPKPPDALDNVMQAVQGDGTPWSYMCASLFAREASEFGAMWHGCSWSDHQILDASPTPGPGVASKCSWPVGVTALGDQLANMTLRDAAQLVAYLRKVHKIVPTSKQPSFSWNWNFCPDSWLPCCIQERDTVCVQFYTYSGQNPERILRHTDHYQVGSYVCESKVDLVAVGPGGYVC